MFDREAKFNQFLLGYFDKIVADIPADQITERGPGGLHPPVWVLGHLAICAELGQMLLGGELKHRDWVEVFGPQSSDDVNDAGKYSKDKFVQVIRDEYPKLAGMLGESPQERLDQPHGIDVLDGSGIETVADAEVHLLTTHLAFHLAQLSGWRRASGKGPLL